MNTMDLTVQLPQAEAHFLEDYARRHATTVGEVVARYARRLEKAGRLEPHPENLKFTGQFRRKRMFARYVVSTS